MMDLPSRREFKVLKALCFDSVEDRRQWPGVGGGAGYERMDRPATCETYGTVGFLATKAGHEAHEAGWKAGPLSRGKTVYLSADREGRELVSKLSVVTPPFDHLGHMTVWLAFRFMAKHYYT